MRNIFLVFLFSMLCGTASAQTTVPYTFTAGTTAQASQVNADFQALATAIDGLTASVNKLNNQLSAADLVGTYNFNAISINIDGCFNNTNCPASPVDVSHGVAKATVTLNANGTYTTNYALSNANLDIKSYAITTSLSNQPDSGTWSWNGTTLTLTNPNPQNIPNFTLSIVGGGRLFIGADTYSSGGSTDRGTYAVFMSRN